MNARAQRVLGRRVVALGLSWVMAATSVWSVAPPVRAAGPAPSLQPVLAWAVPAFGSPAAVAAAAAGAAPAIVAPALVASAAAAPVACDWSALRPTRFVRTKGAPNTYTTTFDIPGWVTAPQALRVRNGEPNGAFRVSSATIKVGSTTVFRPSDFNTQVATLERSVTLSPRTTLTVTLASAPGSYLTIEACGTNGDATPPTIAVAEPAAAAFLSDPTPRLRVTYHDAPPGLVSGVDPTTLVVKVDGVDRTALFTRLSAEATAAWPEAEPLAPGPHAIEVEVRDRAGNPASAQSSFTIDTQAPQVAVAEPAAGASLATLQPTLRVTYADDLGLDLATLRLRIDGADRTAEFAVGPGAATATLALAAGPHVLQAEVRDRAGNLASASAPFTLDGTPPALAITEPTSGARLGADLVAVIVRFSDDQALDETTLVATLDGAPLELSAGTDTAMTVAGPLADGPHVLEVRLRDRAGNEAAASAAFAVDTTRPDLRVADPFAGALLITATPSVRLVYSDAQGLDLSSLRVRIAGQEQSFSVGPDAATLAATPPLPEGEVTIEAEIADLTGNRASVSTAFTVDTLAPEASLAAPQVRFVGTATPELNFTLSDAGSGTGVDVASVRVFVDGTEIAATVTPALAIAQAPPLAEGEHTVRVTLRDLAGNAAEASGAFVVDLTPPAVSLVSPVAGSVGNDAEPELRLALADPPGGEGVLPSGIDPATLRAFVQAGDAPEVEVPFVVTGGEAVARLAAPLPDGTTRLRVQVADVAGHSAEAAFAFDVDTVAPGLFVDAPALDELLATAQPAVALRYTDDRAGIDAARLVLRVDGTEVALSPGETGATGVLPAQGEGRHVLEAEIADRAGNVTSVTGHGFTVDTVAPVLTVAAPLAGAYLGTATPAVQVGWSDATTGVDPPSVRAWLDGIELPVAGATAEGVAFATPPVADGAHVVRVAVADRAGNVGETEVGFFTDTTAPSVPSLEPGDGSYHPQLDEQGRLQVTGQASDLDPRLTVQCRVGDTVVTASLADGAFACAVPLAEGENEVTVTARDGNGHETSRTRTLNLDTKDPEVAIREPQPDAITAATSVDVAFDVTDASPVTASVDGLTAAAEPCAPGAACAFSATGVAVGAGPFATLTATATDAAGHEGSASVRLRVDRDAPAIEFTKPAAGSFASGAAVDVEGTVLDASAVLVHVNGIPAEVSGGGAFTGQPHAHAFRATVPVAEGPAALEVVAWDEAGNSANAQRSITVDSVPPALVITAPAPGLATRATTLEIRGTVSDATAVEVTVDGTAAALAAGEFAFTASLPAEGPRSFVVRARDAAGNVSEATVTVTVDRTPPTLAIATPDEGAIVKALPLAVAGTVTDATGVVVSVQGAAATVAGSAWSAELSLDEGTRTVEVVATDAAGNEVRLARSVQVDLFAPELDVTAPAAGLLTREAAVPVAGSVRDASSVGVTVNGVAATVTGGPCASGCAFGATVELPEGDSQVLVVATDAAGRASEFAVPVTRDSTPPTLALVTPEKISAGRPGQAVASVADNLGLQAATLSARVTAECSLGSVSGTGPSLLLDLVVPDCARPGDTVTVTLDATDHAGNAAATSRALRVVADGAIAGQALDAATGLPLAGVEVQAASTTVATGADGRYALPATDSRVVLALARAGYSRVERVVEVASGQGTVAVDAFLTPLAQPVTLSEPGTLHVHGGAATCSGADSTCSPSDLRVAVAAPGTYGVTGLSPQALPNLLPLGWSALAALDLSSDGGAATLIASGVAGPLHLARYSASLHAWVMEAPGVAVVDGVATVALPGAGAFALVVADATEPPLAVPAAGEAFEGLPMVPLPETAASAGRVTPPVIPPTGGTALGAIEIAEAPGVPSGTVVQAEVHETYTLASGEEASTEPRTFDIVVSRQAALGVECPAAALCASFPITPSRSYAPAELSDGRVHLDILAGREGVRGTVGGGSEAVTLAAGDVSVSVPRGALDEDLALAVEAQSLSSFLPSNAGLVPLGEFTFDASGATLRAEAQVALAAAVAAGDSAVLVRVERVAGVPYLVVVAALDVEAERVVSRAVPGLPGLREGGRYVAYRIAGPVAFVSGITTASGTPVQARVTGGSLPFHAFTKADGSWVLAAVPGPAALQASVPGTSLAGAATVQVPAPPDVAPPTPIALAGVVTTATVSPADGAVAVAPTASVTIEAAAPIAANSVTAEGVRLVDDATDAAVAVRFVLSTSGRTLSVIPLQALAFATRYRLEAPGLRDTFGGLVQVPITRFTTRADTPPQYDLAAIRFGYPTPEGLVQVTAPADTLPPGTEILIINAGNGAVVTFTAENDGSLGTTFPADLPATISDTLYVTVTDPLGNVTTFTRSEYVAEDGTTGIGPGGGTVRGEGGVELRIPEGALKKGATLRVEGLTADELEALFPGQRPPTGTLASGLRIDSADKPAFEKEADLAFPRPNDAPEGAFYYVYRRIQGPEGRVLWETLDHAFVDGDGTRVVTASYPFGGYRNSLGNVEWSVGGAAALNAAVSNYAYLMWTFDELQPGRPLPGAITGEVLRARHDGDGTQFDAVPLALVSRLGPGGEPLYRGEGSVAVALTQPDGRFTLWDGQYVGGQIKVAAEAEGEFQTGTAFDGNPLDFESTGLRFYQNVAVVNLTFPALEPPPPPPAVDIVVQSLDDGTEVGATTLTGRTLTIDVFATAPVLAISVDGMAQTLVADPGDPTHTRTQDPFVVTRIGTLAIAVVVENGFGQAETVTRMIRVLAPGVGVFPRPGEAPFVLAPISPADRATRVAATTSVEIQFSEPVSHVRDVSTALDGIYVEEQLPSGTVVAAVPVTIAGITADGSVVEPLERADVPVVAVSLVPRAGLKGGVHYRVRVDATIRDADGDRLVPFESRFTTFGPSELPAPPVGAELASPGVATIDGRAYMVGIHPGGALQGEVRGWDVADPLAPRLLAGRTIVTHRPIDIVGEADNPIADGGRLLVVATGPNSRSQPSNIYAIDVSDDGAFRWIGAASLTTSALDGFVTRLALSGRSLFAATVRKGVQVVDLERARDQFQAVGGPLGLLPGGRPVTQPFNTDGEGWGQGAVTLTVPIPTKPSGAHYYLSDLAVAQLAGVPHVFVASEAGLVIMDVAQAALVYPAAFTQSPAGVPTPLGSADGVALNWARAIAALPGQDVVVVAGDDGAGRARLFTIDVSEPVAPRILGHVVLGLEGSGLTPVDVVIADRTAIVGAQSSAGAGRLVFVSLSDLSTPLVASSVDGPGGHLGLLDDGLLVSTARSAFGGTTPLTGMRLTALDPVTAAGATTCEGSVDLWTPRVSIQKTVDRVNDFSCADPGRIAFVVCKPSRVSLLLEGSPLVASLDGGPEAPLTDLALAPGFYVAHVSAAGLGDLAQPLSFAVKGVPDDGGAPETQPGVIELDVLSRAVLPVGRTFVKGVDLFDGHVVQQSADLSLPGRHLGLEVRRTYSNSGPRPDGAMGAGWSWNFDAGLDETACGLVNLSTADGSNQVFRTADGGATFVPQKGYHGTLRKTAQGLYVYTDKAAVEHTFEPAGSPVDPEGYRLARVVEPHGDSLVLSYDGRRRLVRVDERHAEKSAPVRTLEMSYARSGGYERVKEVVVRGPKGRGLGLRVVYEHDPETGNLLRVTRTGENVPGAPPALPRVEAYEYETTGEGLDGWRTRHRLKATVDPNGNRVEYEYFTLEDEFPGPPTLLVQDQDQFVKVVREFPDRQNGHSRYETRFEYDFSKAVSDLEWVTTVVNARDHETVYVLDGNGSPKEVREPLGRTTRAGWAATDVLKEWEADPNGRITRFEYDSRGNRIAEKIETQDLGVVEARYEYHPRFNKLVRQRDASGRETIFELDAATGDLTRVTDAEGNVTRHEYDAHGQLVRTTSPRGHATEHSSFHPVTGAPQSSEDPLGNRTFTTLDDRGRLVAVADTMGRKATTVFDGLDRPLAVTRHAGQGQPAEVALTEYFAGGQPRKTTTAAGLETTFDLDGLNRVTRTVIRVPGGVGFPGEELAATREYDGNGNVVRETDRRGVAESHTYDALDRLESTAILAGPDTGPLGEVARFTYDAVGNKLTERDVAGLVTEYQYDGLYRVSRRIFPQGRAGGGNYFEAYGYDLVGNRTRFEDANGRVTVTEYDGLNRVTRVTRDVGGLELVATTTYGDPEGSRVNKAEEFDASTGLRTSFVHDALDREIVRTQALEGPGGEGESYATRTRYVDAEHAIEVADPRQKVTRIELDGLDREVERVIDLGGLELRTSQRHDATGQVATAIDARRNPVTRVHDALGRLRRATDAEGFESRFGYDGEGLKTSETDSRGVSKVFSYDNLGRPRVTEVLPSPALSNLGHRTEVTYDDAGRRRVRRNARGKDTVEHLDGMDRVVREVGPDGAEIVRNWDGVNKVGETDRRGNLTTFLYDGIDRLRQATDPAPFQAQAVVTTYVDGANRVEETDRRGILTVRQFDPLGRLRSVARGGLLLEEHRYDGNGNKLSSRDADGRETRFEYDGANRLTAQVVGFGTADASRTEYSLDPNGNVTEERDARALARGPGAFSTKRTYFKTDRLKTEQDGLGNQTEHVYDGEGNRTLLRSPRQTETQYAYDEVGKLLAVTQPVPGPSLERPVTRYAYDANRNLERQEDAGGAVVTMSYDDMDRLTLRRQDPAGLDLRTQIEAYDHDGRVLRLKDANGQIVVSTYDELGRLDTKVFSAIVGAVEPWRQPVSEGYAYDANGNVTTIVESVASGTDPPLGRTTTRTYDSLDRLESETTTLPDAGSKQVSYSYFASGLRKTVTSPEGLVTRHAYDGQGRHLSATVADGTPVAETTTYGYHPNGLLHTVTTPNGVVATYEYDDADRLLSVVNAAGSEPISSFAYTYDVNGNRLTQEERHGLAAAESTAYTYDGLDRLASVTYPDKSVAYEYDGAGNRKRETETVAGVVVSDRRGTFDGANRLTTLVDAADPSRSTTFGWDGNGNQISKTEAGVTTDFVFDVRDKLVEVQSPAGVLARFTYDADGRRTQKIGEDGIRHFVYDDTSLYAEYDQSGLPVARYDYGSDRLLALWRADEGRRFFSLDGLNSVVSLTGEGGDLISSYHLDAWGNYRNPDELEASKNRFGFTGHLFDRETGTYYAKARYFDPGLGRFLSQDTYLGEIDAPPSLHRYAYGWNRPTFFIDPTGFAPEKVGTVYVLRGIDPETGEAVKYTGSTIRELKSRFSNHKWKALYKADTTTITSEEVWAEPNKAASGRGTLRSAKMEAARAIEQTTMDRVAKEPGRALNAPRAATEENVAKWREIHGAEARNPQTLKVGKGAPPAGGANATTIAESASAAESSAAESTATRPRPTGGGVAGVFIGFAAYDAARMAREQGIEDRYVMAPILFEDEGGEFTLSPGTWPFSKTEKRYVGGNNDGRVVPITGREYADIVDEHETLFGYIDWKGDFVPGKVRQALPVVERTTIY